MLKLVKFLKPFLLSILLAILLLFIQANADLALPDYLSRIVNFGIQQGGVENGVPEIVLESDLPHIELFIAENDAAPFRHLYELLKPQEDLYKDYKKLYPNIKGNIYTLKSKDNMDPTTVTMVSKAMLSFMSINKLIQDNGGKPIKLGPKEFPPGTPLFDVIKQMPTEQRKALTDQFNARFEQLGESSISQAAATMVGQYYSSLGRDLHNLQQSYIITTGAIMLVITIIGAFASILVGFIGSLVAAGLGRNLRGNIFKKVQSFSNVEFDKFSTASLITRSTNDVTQIQTLMVLVIRMVFYAPIMGVGGVIRALQKNSSMSWIIALGVGILLILIVAIFFIVLPRYKGLQKLVDNINRVARENLSGIMVIRAFNTQHFEEERFDEANKDLTKTNLFVNRVMVALMPLMMLVMNGISLLIVWVGANEIQKATMQVGDMIAFMQYAMQIIMAFLMLSMMFILIPRASVSATRIAEILETSPDIKDLSNPKPMPTDISGTVSFRDVSFRYPGAEEDTLSHISFEAKAGETTAIIGSTGSGKTTLVNLIPRFYDVTGGEVDVNDINVKDVSQHDLRNTIGYIPQKASLFSGTIKSNLRFANENASDSLLAESAAIAQATEIIDEKDDGYEAHISQGGQNVSGGQKQRFSIARALVKKAKIYIFDDSFSALDFKTDAALRRQLKEKLVDRTIIIVAQRISTIRHADQIIVLDNGKMVGLGSHEELMKNCATYKEIALSQLSEEELA